MISVITAALNCRQDLIRTRNSVLRQRGVEIQHIVVDGGSTDGTRELLAEWATDENFRFVSETDTGVYDAFNKGLRLAEGDCIGFLNAGDIYEDDDVLYDVASAFNDPYLDLVFGDIEITRARSVEKTVRKYSSADFTTDKLLLGFMPPHPSIYAKKSLYLHVGLFSTDFRIAGDFDWMLRAFLIVKLRSRRLDRVFVRMPAGGVSNKGLMSVFHNTREIHKALVRNGFSASWLTLFMRLPVKWFRR